MYTNDNENTTIYKVVVNHEEQYSIWPGDRDNTNSDKSSYRYSSFRVTSNE